MEKEFLSYSQSLSLKELGFDEPCFGYFDCERDFQFVPNKKKFLICEVSRPTFSQTFKWFREKHNLYHEIRTFVWDYDKKELGFSIRTYLNPIDIETERLIHSEVYKTYEEAESSCVDKLIDIIKKK